jgi:hypothetical protein
VWLTVGDIKDMAEKGSSTGEIIHYPVCNMKLA